MLDFRVEELAFVTASDGRHYQGLDHLRALAAFMVVFWHFAHRPEGNPVPNAQVPFLGLLDEGHAGVALFMTLSGYLFAKLIGDRDIDYRQFFINRMMRLFPLLVVVLTFNGLLFHRADPLAFLAHLAGGLIMPNWPMGAWSIAVELQFYLLLPLLLGGTRRLRWLPLALVALMLLVRTALFFGGEDVQHLAFFSLVGRIDQFLIGIYIARNPLSDRASIVGLGSLVAVYAIFTAAGGYYGPDSGDWMWIVLPTLEAIGFAALIGWYERRPLGGTIMDTIGLSGTYSYAIYLLHGFLVTPAAALVDQMFGLDSILEALPFAFLFFVYLTLLGGISYRFIEQPFLRRRRPYLRPAGRVSEPIVELAPLDLPKRKLT